MQTVTGKKIDIPAEWRALGARLGDLVNVIADRDDLVSLVFPGNSSPSAEQAAAWFVPSTARVNVDADKVLPGVHPDDVDLYTPQGQATHMGLMGALVHECAHAAHTVLKFPKKLNVNHAQWGLLLEETRIEKKALARRPQDRPFLAACATELVFGGNLTMQVKGGKHTSTSLARSAILLLGRVDAGVFDSGTLDDVQSYFEAEFGQDNADTLRGIWLKAQDLDDGDLDGLVACGKEVYDLIASHEDAPEEQEPQKGEQSDAGDGSPGETSDSNGSGSGSGSSSEDSDDESGEGADESGESGEGASGGNGATKSSKGASGNPKGAQGDSDDETDKDDDSQGSEPETDADDNASGAGKSDDESDDEDSDGKDASGASGDSDDEGTEDDGTEDEDVEAFQMPCGSWTEGDINADSDDDDSDGDADGDSDGESNGDGDSDSDGAMEKAIQAAMKKISVDAKRDVTLTTPVRRNLKKQRDAAAKEKREFIRNKNTADRVFRAPTAGAPGLFGASREITVFQQKPTAADKRNANMLTKELRKAQHRDIHRAQVPSMIPPGRMLINEAARRDAQRSRGEEITATPWRQTRRRVVQSPPLLVGFSVDVSGSMDAWQEPVASFGWALANAVRTLEGKIASVAWNGGTKPVMFPGRIYKDIQVAQCGGVSNGLATSLDALDGEIDLARAEGVRVQVILTDGEIDQSGVQERIDRLTHAGVLVIWIETPSQSWWGNQQEFGGYVPKGVKHLPLKDPNVFGQVVGRFIADALSQHQGNA